jgi:transcriptional regulator with XRE-family HTH domain
MDNIKVGERIKAEREKADWKQTKLAQLAEIRPSTLSQIERGDRFPSTEVLQKIAKALNVSVSRLLGQTHEDELVDLLQDKEIEVLFRDFKGLSAPDKKSILKLITAMKAEKE